MSRLCVTQEEKEKAWAIVELLSGMSVAAAEVAIGEAQSLIIAIRGKVIVDSKTFDEP
jgi:hypothetical protein